MVVFFLQDINSQRMFRSIIYPITHMDIFSFLMASFISSLLARVNAVTL